jgi:hypothetical protein
MLKDVVFQLQVDGLAEEGGLRLVRIQVTAARPILFEPSVHFPAPFGFGRFGIRHSAGCDGLERMVFPVRAVLGNLAKWTVSGVEK